MLTKRLSFLCFLVLTLLLFSSCGIFNCKHKEYNVKTVPPTCTAEGYTEHTCKKCGESYRDSETSIIAHDYSSEVVAPTCTAEGYTEHTCKECGESYRDSETSIIAHDYSSEVVAPTCAVEGYTKHTCTVCGDSYTDTPTDKTTHYFVGEACSGCGMEEITENITPDTEWYNAELAIFDLTTPEQLAGLASLVNAGTDFAGVKIYLDADIDLGFYQWIPIGNATYAFNGTFDGDGHTISGLKINAGSDYVGLFGNVSGKICNFNIEKANIYVKRDHNYVSVACGYLTGEIKDISTDGFIEAPKSNYVGAVAGATTAASIGYTNLTSMVSINGQSIVGGIIGQVNASGNVQINYVNNTGSVKGTSQVGGIIGQVNTSGILQTDYISNIGDVNGTSQVGGIFGYVNGANGSLVSGASVSADIVGDYYIGGIVGKAENVVISSCTNDGSTITSNSYYTEGSNFYVWLGGFVGYGYSVTNCTNNVDITYNAKGSYVGGIAGYAVSDVKDCTNNGDITTNTSCVGGIAGEISSGTQRNLSNLTNTGNVVGNTAVGGILGSLYQVNNTMATYEYTKILKYDGGSQKSYTHMYCYTTTLSRLSNFGTVLGSEDSVGGIFGKIYVNSSGTMAASRHCHTMMVSFVGDKHRCNFISDFRIVADNLVNFGNVEGKNAGELFGYFNSDAPSTLITYTVTGKVTINDEIKEGTYDVGANTNLTLSGREIYTEENTETVE